MSHTRLNLYALLTTIALFGFGYATYSLMNPPQLSRLICKSAGQPEEMGRGIITYHNGLYRFTGKKGGIATYDKSLFEACVIVPEGTE